MSFWNLLRKYLLFRWLFGSRDNHRSDSNEICCDRCDRDDIGYESSDTYMPARDLTCRSGYASRHNHPPRDNYHHNRDLELYYDDPADYDPTDFDDTDDLDYFGMSDDTDRFNSDFMNSDYSDRFNDFDRFDSFDRFDNFDDY